ncbi:MAG TPA: RNA polymerase sigma factor [Methylomirabilota bacterium]|nr:RNA polymerase sigma factor [Methylomirabilota bacterium]
MELDEEKKLVEEAKSNPSAFGTLYDLYYTKIANYILHRVGNVAVAQDITSDVFFKAMKSVSSFTWRNISFSSWLYKIASNEINSYFRKKKYKIFSLDILFEKHNFELQDKSDIEQDFIEAQNKLEEKKDFVKVQKILTELPLHYQEIIVLRYFEKKKLKEICEITGKNSNTVKSLLLRGLERVKKKFFVLKNDETQMLQPFSQIRVLERGDNR